MSANAKIVDPVTGNATLVRPRFSPGLLLRDDDLRQGVEYTRDLSRLLMRSLFGCGVVCGLVVETELKCGKLLVTVNRGIGLTCLGDPVEVPRPKTVTIDPTCGRELPDRLWVVLCRTEKCCAPRSAVCGCDEDEAGPVCTREHDQFEIRILERPMEGACGCPEPEEAAAPTPQPSTPQPAQKAASKSTRKTAAQKAAQKSVASAVPEAGPAPDRSAGAVPGGGQSYPAVAAATESCWCADPCSPCYRDHYEGECGCECCDCECLTLAVLNRRDEVDDTGMELVVWKADHSVRRFMRPVPMRDPQAWKESNPDTDPCPTSAQV